MISFPLALPDIELVWRLKSVLDFDRSRLCSATCRKPSLFHALLEYCLAPHIHLATRLHNFRRLHFEENKFNQTRQAFGRTCSTISKGLLVVHVHVPATIPTFMSSDKICCGLLLTKLFEICVKHNSPYENNKTNLTRQ